MSAETIINLPTNHGAQSTNLPWYQPSLENKLDPKIRKLFEVEAHVYEVRKLAWSIFPWPCIGEFWFLELGLSRHPEHDNILRILQDSSSRNPKLLDLGTCLGQALRELAHNGVPISSLYGADLVSGFESAGYELFRDSDRFGPENSITGNIFSEDKEDGLVRSRGGWDIVHATMFLHIWSLAEQEQACINILKMLRLAPGSMVVGTQTGNINAGEFTVKPPLCEPGEHKVVWRHSRETMKDMWTRAGKKLHLDLEVRTEYDEEERIAREKGRLEQGPDWEARQRFFTGEDERRVFFNVVRV